MMITSLTIDHKRKKWVKDQGWENILRKEIEGEYTRKHKGKGKHGEGGALRLGDGKLGETQSPIGRIATNPTYKLIGGQNIIV